MLLITAAGRRNTYVLESFSVWRNLIHVFESFHCVHLRNFDSKPSECCFFLYNLYQQSPGSAFCLQTHWISWFLDCWPNFFLTSLSAAYEGFSTFRPVVVAVKHLWNRSSGSGGWLSQSSFLLMKCFLNPCGPETQVALPWLGPSLGSPIKKQPDNSSIAHCSKSQYLLCACTKQKKPISFKCKTWWLQQVRAHSNKTK